jgi:hypothetical protein
LEIVFNHKYWGLLFFISFVLASGITLIFYFRSRENSELKPWQLYILMAFRFIAVFSVALLLTGPMIKSIRKIVQNPVILIGTDNSSSVLAFQDEGAADKTTTMADYIRRSLGEKFEVIEYTFGETVRRGYTLSFTEKRSAYGAFIESVYNNHFNENVGALLVIGDGINNQGENPLNVARQLSYPVYTVGLGDTTAHRDVRIAALRVNRNAFLGNKFPVEADIRFQGMANQIIKFSIVHKGVTVFSENLFSTGNDGFKTISTYLDAADPGLQYYTVRVETTVDEKNRANNMQDFVINILENKQKILILSNGSHPDAGAIKDALEKLVNYEVTLFTREPYPGNFEDYSLIVVNQLPTASQSGRQIIDEVSRHRIPLLILVGSQTYIPQLNLWGLGTEIVLQAGNMEEAQNIVNKDFVTFTLTGNLVENLERYPPLMVPFARYSLDASWNVLAYQRIRNIPTDRPVIAVSNRNGIKSGIIFGEGIWRWRLYNYLMSENQDEFTELMDKLVQYLALRDNDDNFIIDFKSVYQETETVKFSAEVYNDAFEPIYTPNVSLVLRDSTNREFTYQFDKGGQFYRLDAGILPPGNYKFEAEVKIGDKIYTESGSFAVMPVNIELLETQANHRMLFQLASQSGGTFYLPTEVEDLISQISDNTQIKPFTYFQSLLNEILNLRWIFFVILMFFSIEWFLRKYWGIY